MPDSDTFSLMGFCKIRYSNTKVLIFSMMSENIMVSVFWQKERRLSFKRSSLEEAQLAIHTVLNGCISNSDSLKSKLAIEAIAGFASNIFELSKREFEICLLLTAGRTISCSIAQLIGFQMGQ